MSVTVTTSVYPRERHHSRMPANMRRVTWWRPPRPFRCVVVSTQKRELSIIRVRVKRLLRDELREHGQKHRLTHGGEKASTADYFILCRDSEYVDGMEIVELVALLAIARGDLPTQAFIEDLRAERKHLVEEVPGAARTAILNGNHHHQSSSSVYWRRSATTEDASRGAKMLLKFRHVDSRGREIFPDRRDVRLVGE